MPPHPLIPRGNRGQGSLVENTLSKHCPQKKQFLFGVCLCSSSVHITIKMRLVQRGIPGPVSPLQQHVAASRSRRRNASRTPDRPVMTSRRRPTTTRTAAPPIATERLAGRVDGGEGFFRLKTILPPSNNEILHFMTQDHIYVSHVFS